MNNNQTLQQGLELFQLKNTKYFSERVYTDRGEAFIKSHDIAHVVFGCDTTIYGEGVVKVWTTFGSNLSFWKVTTGYNEVNAFELSRAYSKGHVVKNILGFLWVIPKTIIRARKMKKPWPFYDYEPYLDRPISEIRREFNIVVL